MQQNHLTMSVSRNSAKAVNRQGTTAKTKYLGASSLPRPTPVPLNIFSKLMPMQSSCWGEVDLVKSYVWALAGMGKRGHFPPVEML